MNEMFFGLSNLLFEKVSDKFCDFMSVASSTNSNTTSIF